MYERKAKILPLRFAPGRRILVISDIHGNLAYFDALLEKAGFCGQDELIIDGDFLEKGPDSLGVLRRIMELSKGGNVHAVLGNCDNWADLYQPDWTEEAGERVMHYIMWRQSGLLWEMLNASGVDLFEMESLGDFKELLRRRYEAEWAFLESLPDAIETENFVFAHAGADPDKPLREHTQGELCRLDSLLTTGRKFKRWLIVGHWPVMLYGQDRVCANPIIDRDKRIVSIDGGCVLKDDGQLNALIIPDRDSTDFEFVAYDPFPVRTVTRDQAGSERSYYIRWGDSQVRVLRRGEEFSRCRHVRTGYEMDILTKYLYSDGEYSDCNDSTDYVLPLKAGDRVSVIEETSLGYLVKHKGVSGWYYGELK